MERRQVSAAQELQEERRRAASRPLPLWVAPVLLFFGWNELMAIVWNPLWLVLSVVALAFGVGLYRALDVDREMEKGLPAAGISIARRIGPTARRLVANSFQSAVTAVENLGPDGAAGSGGASAAGGGVAKARASPEPATPVLRGGGDGEAASGSARSAVDGRASPEEVGLHRRRMAA